MTSAVTNFRCHKSAPSRGPIAKPHHLPHPWTRPTYDAKRHPDPIRRFSTMHWTGRQTDQQTDRQIDRQIVHEKVWSGFWPTLFGHTGLQMCKKKFFSIKYTRRYSYAKFGTFLRHPVIYGFRLQFTTLSTAKEFCKSVTFLTKLSPSVGGSLFKIQCILLAKGCLCHDSGGRCSLFSRASLSRWLSTVPCLNSYRRGLGSTHRCAKLCAWLKINLSDMQASSTVSCDPCTYNNYVTVSVF